MLGFLGIFMAGDSKGVMENGFFYGYTSVVVAVILLQVRECEGVQRVCGGGKGTEGEEGRVGKGGWCSIV